MQVDFERYPPINIPFEDRKLPGSLQFKRQSRHTLSKGGGTYGMSNIRYQKPMKHISSGGYTLQRGPNTQYFKVPRGQSVRALKIAQQIPRSGSVLRVVGTENSEEQQLINPHFGHAGGHHGGKPPMPPTQSSFYAHSPHSFPSSHQSSGIQTPKSDLHINYHNERDNMAVSRRGVPGVFQPPPPLPTGQLYPSLEYEQADRAWLQGKSTINDIRDDDPGLSIMELPNDDYDLPETGNMAVVRYSGSSHGTSPSAHNSPPPLMIEAPGDSSPNSPEAPASANSTSFASASQGAPTPSPTTTATASSPSTAVSSPQTAPTSPVGPVEWTPEEETARFMFNSAYRQILADTRSNVEPLVRQSLDAMMEGTERVVSQLTLTTEQRELMASILAAVGQQTWHHAQTAGLQVVRASGSIMPSADQVRNAGQQVAHVGGNLAVAGANMMPTAEQIQAYAQDLVSVSREAGRLVLSATGTSLRYVVPRAMRALVSGAGSMWELLERMARFVQRPDVHDYVRMAASDMAAQGSEASRQVYDYISPIIAHMIAGSIVLFRQTLERQQQRTQQRARLQRANVPGPIITEPDDDGPAPAPAAARPRRRRRRNSMEIGIADSTYQPEFHVRKNSPEYGPAQSTRSKVNRSRQPR